MIQTVNWILWNKILLNTNKSELARVHREELAFNSIQFVKRLKFEFELNTQTQNTLRMSYSTQNSASL
jgi:hypothetical protein